MKEWIHDMASELADEHDADTMEVYSFLETRINVFGETETETLHERVAEEYGDDTETEP